MSVSRLNHEIMYSDYAITSKLQYKKMSQIIVHVQIAVCVLLWRSSKIHLHFPTSMFGYSAISPFLGS
jgi:hypothetical protein